MKTTSSLSATETHNLLQDVYKCKSHKEPFKFRDISEDHIIRFDVTWHGLF